MASTDESLQAYLAQHNINELFAKIVEELLVKKPDQPKQFVIDYLYSTSPDLAPSPGFARVGGGAASSAPESKYAQEDSSEDEDEDDEDDFDDGEMLPVRTRKKIDPANRRNSVSAACIDPAALAAFDLAAHKGPAKSPEESARIARFVKKSILFKALDDEQVQVIVDSMKPMTFANGENLIEQGDEGDHFYILDKGTCDCFVTPKGEDERKCVKKYVESDYFGDLALMYNAPRAATVTASSAVTVWALEQSVFKNVIVSTTVSKRSMYGDWLRTVPILATLEQAEVDKAADALNEERFEDGDCIIRQDTSGDKFYIVKTGNVKISKVDAGEKTEFGDWGPGKYFGEIALLSDRDRQATAIADGAVVVLSMHRNAFTRVFGSLLNVLKREAEVYGKYTEGRDASKV